MNNDNMYYDCKRKHYDGGIILCKACEEWMDKVDEAIEERKVDEHTTVSNRSKLWNNSKLRKTLINM